MHNFWSTKLFHAYKCISNLEFNETLLLSCSGINKTNT